MPFDVQVVIPGSKAAGGTRHPDFKKAVPGGTIPALKDGDFVLSESIAILQYLCDKNGWNDFYPKDVQQRALVDQITHWSHRTIRETTIGYLFPLFRPGDAKMPKFFYEASQKIAVHSIGVLEDNYLQSRPYLTGDHPTIADIVVYTEVQQLRAGNLLDLSSFPKVCAWLDRMQKLPGHDVAFASLHALGDMSEKTALTPEEMKNGTIAGLKAIRTFAAKL